MRPSSKLSLLVLALAPVAMAGAAARPARADADVYEVQKKAAPATAGVPSNVSLTVVGKSGWHVNEEAPITVSLKADPGVELPKVKLTRADLAASTKQSARFDIAFSAAEAGKKTITASARFVMCQEQACKPVSETVAFDVDVAPAAPAPAAATKSAAKTKKRAN